MRTRTAVILAAGLGSRLAPLTDDRPKALVDVGGETILHRAVRLLREFGVEHVVLATGYRQDALERAARDFGVSVTFVPNPQYASTQNSVSLALCAKAVGQEAFFKLDGDVVFDPRILERLEQARAPLAVAVDSSRKLDEEAMKVSVEGLTITAFGKQIPLADSAGESIGIERLSAEAGAVVFERMNARIREGQVDRYYEDYYGELIAERKLVAQRVEVGDLPWTEIDDHQDLEHARSLIRG